MKNINISYNENDNVDFFTHSIDLISKESLNIFNKGFLFQGFALPSDKLKLPDQFSRWSQVISADDLELCEGDLAFFVEMFSNRSAIELLTKIKFDTLKVRELPVEEILFLKSQGLITELDEIVAISNRGIILLSLIVLWGNIFRQTKSTN